MVFHALLPRRKNCPYQYGRLFGMEASAYLLLSRIKMFSPDIMIINYPLTNHSKLFISGGLLNLKEPRKVYKWK
jgi:hypothetical protein